MANTPPRPAANANRTNTKKTTRDTTQHTELSSDAIPASNKSARKKGALLTSSQSGRQSASEEILGGSMPHAEVPKPASEKESEDQSTLAKAEQSGSHSSEPMLDVPTRRSRTRKNPSTAAGGVLPPVPPGVVDGVPTREAILQVLRETNSPLSPADLAKRLALPETAQTGFTRRLAAMERDGQLMPNRKGVLLLAKKLDFIAGKVTGHRDGFGFLIRDDVGPDVFLTPKEMLKVLHGDRVLVKLVGRDSRGRPEGSIVEVIERRTNRLVGRFLSERGLYLVVPEDQRIKHDILIPPAEIHHAQHGQVVMVEILEQPTRYAQPLGRVVEVLGEVDDPGMEIEIAVRKFDVPYRFTQAVLDEAERLPAEVQHEDLQERIDLRDIAMVTIDGEDARDFDDAVYCEAATWQEGQAQHPAWRLLVAIADVSHYVRDHEPLDIEAAQRSTSVYFPRRVIPMLPEKLSNGLCSLNPLVDRLVLVCDMLIPQAGRQVGEVVAYQFYPAVIHSQARLTYNEVWQALSEPQGPAAQRQRRHLPQLEDLHALYKLLSARRKARGAIDFDTVETQIVCNELGRIERIVPRRRNDAHKLIEECMLAANVAAADFIERSKHPGLFRIHEGPTPEKLESLRTFLKSLGMQLGGGDNPQPADYAELLGKIRNRPDAPLLQSMCLRSMQQAIYSPDNVGHFGLAYAAYTHFTSPIRRYPDLLTHRVIKALLQGRRYQPSLHELQDKSRDTPSEREHLAWEKIGLICSANERRADEATRDVEAWLKSWFMKERVGETFTGTISGVASFGIFVTLNELFVEGLVHVSELGSEYFQFNDVLHELRGERTGIRYRLTDSVNIQVSRVDLEARRIEFRLVRDAVKSLRYEEVQRLLKPSDKPEASEPSRKASRSSRHKLKSEESSSSRKASDKTRGAASNVKAQPMNKSKKSRAAKSAK